MTRVLRAEITEEPVDLAELEALVAMQAAGAVVGFAGVIRDHDGGRSVIRLEYSAHPSAQDTLAEVLADIAEAPAGCVRVAASHRIGTLASVTRRWWPRWPPITARRRSRRAPSLSTPSRRGYRCGSTSSSPTDPTSGWAPPEHATRSAVSGCVTWRAR